MHLFFFGDAGEAARGEGKASKTYEGPVGTRNNVLFAFDEEPRAEESDMLEACLKAPRVAVMRAAEALVRWARAP